MKANLVASENQKGHSRMFPFYSHIYSSILLFALRIYDQKEYQAGTFYLSLPYSGEQVTEIIREGQIFLQIMLMLEVEEKMMDNTWAIHHLNKKLF